MFEDIRELVYSRTTVNLIHSYLLAGLLDDSDSSCIDEVHDVKEWKNVMDQEMQIFVKNKT